MENMQEHVRDWLADIRSAGRSAATLEAYSISARKYLEYLEKNDSSSLEGVPFTKSSIRGFMASIAHMKPNSRATRFRALSTFGNWLVAEEIISENPCSKLKAPRQEEPVVDPFSEEEVKKLLAACEGQSFDRKRDKLIILLLSSTGMRRGELCSIAMDNVDSEHNVVWVSGKTGTRPVPLNSATAASLLRYRRHRFRMAHANSPFLFIGQRGPLTVTGIDLLVRTVGQRAGVANVYAHRFRHSFGSAWLSNGGSETGLLAIAGWNSLSMLRRYTKATASTRAIAEFHRMM